jgi:hypothetical protein
MQTGVSIHQQKQGLVGLQSENSRYFVEVGPVSLPFFQTSGNKRRMGTAKSGSNAKAGAPPQTDFYGCQHLPVAVGCFDKQLGGATLPTTFFF